MEKIDSESSEEDCSKVVTVWMIYYRERATDYCDLMNIDALAVNYLLVKFLGVQQNIFLEWNGLEMITLKILDKEKIIILYILQEIFCSASKYIAFCLTFRSFSFLMICLNCTKLFKIN